MAQRARNELKLPSEFAKKIAETLNFKLSIVEETFEFSEDKDGYFWATLKPKKFLDKPDFQTMCRLARDLGGEDYLKGARAWKVPGSLAKKGTPEKAHDTAKEPSGQGTHSEGGYKQPGNALPTTPSGPRLGHILFTVLPIKALLSMPFQSRKDVEGPDFADLVESVRTVGILEPILVRPKIDGLYEIVAGERRVAAAKKAGLTEAPAIVKALSDQEAYEIQLVENVQRKDLTDMEKARMLDMMIKKFSYTQEALAQKLGKQRLWVARHLAILNLQSVSPGIQSEDVTERQAREILSASPDKQQEIAQKINEAGEVPSARELHNIAHPPKVVMCVQCGSATSHPYSAPDRKFYCDENCYKQAQAESVPSAFHEKQTDETELGEPEHAPEEVEKGPLDFAEVTCPSCKVTFRLVHHGPHDHRVRYYKEDLKNGSH